MGEDVDKELPTELQPAANLLQKQLIVLHVFKHLN